MSLASLLHLLGALAWLAAVFLAIAGFGAASLRVAHIRHPRLALAAVTGLGPLIFLGGVMNLFHLIRPSILISVVVFGVLLSAWLLRLNPSATPAHANPSSSPAAKSLFMLAICVCLVRVLSTVHPSNYEPSDDLNFYYAAPVKMIQTHAFAPDPFSERRITSSVGGNQFLDTLILATQPLESIQLADGGLGAILLLLLAFAITEQFELTTLQQSAFALILMIMPQIRLNISFVILPSALFLGLVYLAMQSRWQQSHLLLHASILGATAGAVASMKSTYITHSVLFILCLAAFYAWNSGLRIALQLLIVAAAACFITLLPWMIASGHDSGTWFYPLLGKGIHFSAYGHYPLPGGYNLHTLTHKVLPFCLPILALFAAELLIAERDPLCDAAILLTLTAFISSALVGLATGGDSLKRYNFACVLPAICLTFVVCARRANRTPGKPSWRWLERTSFLAILAIAVSIGLSTFTFEYRNTLHSLLLAPFPYHLSNRSLRARYAAVEHALPSGSTALATTMLPYLFDFSQRNILLADYPGDASPRPGWPARQRGEALAHFLLDHGVGYLIYSYGECDLRPPFETCTQMAESDDLAAIRNPATTSLILGETESGFDARRQYAELAATHPHLYDDGHIYILDLAYPPLQPRHSDPERSKGSEPPYLSFP